MSFRGASCFSVSSLYAKIWLAEGGIDLLTLIPIKVILAAEVFSLRHIIVLRINRGKGQLVEQVDQAKEVAFMDNIKNKKTLIMHKTYSRLY